MKYYKLSEKQLRSLLEDSLELAVLHNAGVDNWCGYDDARSMYEEETGEYPTISDVDLAEYETI